MPFRLSPSTLGLFTECPRCFWLDYVKNIKRPRTIFPSLPSGMDRLFKKNFDSYRKKGQLPPELCTVGKEVSLFGDRSLLDVWRNNFRGISWADRDGNILRGAVDDVLQKGDKLIVLDYKTRGFPLKDDTAKWYQDQLNTYTYLLRKNNYETEDYAYLLFYHPTGINDGGSISFQADLVTVDVNPLDAEKLFEKALETLNGPMPAPAEGCEFCRWATGYHKECG
ncbi:hypothetical protein GF318_04930 [Candidatus Micrarchaeota archaeon]|nr:hypothetical protein [Candidatus Micrarchaeota archaeon]